MPTVTITIDTSALSDKARAKLLKDLATHKLPVRHQPRPKINPDRRMHPHYYEVDLPQALAPKFKGKLKEVVS